MNPVRFYLILILITLVFAAFKVHDERRERQKLCGPLPYTVINGVLYCEWKGAYHKQSKLARM